VARERDRHRFDGSFLTLPVPTYTENMSLQPTVLYPFTLHELVKHTSRAESHIASTILIICSGRETFLQQLSQSLQQGHEATQTEDIADLVTPTLHNISSTRHVKLAFCASVHALLAYLTAYGRAGCKYTNGAREIDKLILVNPLALHAPTPSFSAQGLSRSFAAAAEAALRTGAVLQVVECRMKKERIEDQDEEAMPIITRDEEENNNNAETEESGDPWEQEVSILNVSARRFGSGSGERSWAGRTVKAKRIAARWFRFHNLDDDKASEGLG
jgi:hypothetical protein